MVGVLLCIGTSCVYRAAILLSSTACTEWDTAGSIIFPHAIVIIK